MNLPNPLHPAIVHFPIVLILLGMVIALIAVFWRKGYIPVFAAALLTLGALGAWGAMETGESDEDSVKQSSRQANALLHSHEDWAKRTLAASSIAAVIAMGALALYRFPRVARGTAAAAALAACAASWCVYETGHLGGALVYQHGAGVHAQGVATAPATGKHHGDRD